MRHSPAIVVCVVALSLVGSVPVDALEEPSPPRKPRFVETGEVASNEGHATLRWGLPGGDAAPAPGLIFELEQSRDPAFGNHFRRHRGPEQALFVSGLRDGRTYFRVRAVAGGTTAGPWSEPFVVDIAYPSSGRVVLLLVVGCLVFVATTTAILQGWQRTGRRGRVGRGASA